jgi:hypothetical protein
MANDENECYESINELSSEDLKEGNELLFAFEH